MSQLDLILDFILFNQVCPNLPHLFTLSFSGFPSFPGREAGAHVLGVEGQMSGWDFGTNLRRFLNEVS
jgi:hypothetical protein